MQTSQNQESQESIPKETEGKPAGRDKKKARMAETEETNDTDTQARRSLSRKNRLRGDET